MISSVLDRAVKWGMIPESPCKKVDPPKVPKHQIECLDDMQAAAFLAGMEAAPLEDKALFTLALYTGMRRGELLGLEWPDADFPIWREGAGHLYRRHENRTIPTEYPRHTARY